jgi:ATP-dependent DNA helicase RecQ
MDDLQRSLQTVFGKDDFRSGQREIVESVMNGVDTLAILPTGGGKSLTYQLPAQLLPYATLVISPLIALMKDQVENLPAEMQGRVALINSSLDMSEVGKRLARLKSGQLKLIYAAPERLRQPPFLHAMQTAGVSLVVIDEAHCISQWGHDFRPDYRNVGRAIQTLNPRSVLAATATAPPDVQADIERQIGRKLVRMVRPTWRENLFLQCQKVRGEDDKLWATLEACQKNEGAGLIYCMSRDKCEQISRMLKRYGIEAGFYHAGLPPEERAAAQDRFMSGEVRVMAATVAFGMGVDKADIRFLVHYHPSRTLENYYQEVGRAGRDGAPSHGLLLYGSSDAASATRRSNEDALDVERVRSVYQAVRSNLGKRRYGTISLGTLTETCGDETLVRTALPLLEEVGLLTRHVDTPRNFNLSTDSFGSGESESDPHPEWAEFAGNLDHFGEFSVLEIAQATGVPPEDIEAKLLQFQDAGHILYHAYQRQMLIELLPPPENAKGKLEQLLLHRARGGAARQEAMLNYAKDNRCRHQQIARYFGDTWPHKTCGRCDICTPNDAHIIARAATEPSTLTGNEATNVLSLVRDLGNFALGPTGLMRSLRGTPDAPIKPNRSSNFGALSHLRKADVERLIEALIAANYLLRDDESEWRSVYLTEEGVNALESGEVDIDWQFTPKKATTSPSSRSVSGRKTTPEPVPENVDAGLLTMLKQWRGETARELAMPPYVVFADKVLVSIAANKPQNEFDLTSIPGIGPKKAAQYGEIVLEMVQAAGK